jgi:hypothetical protein
MVLPSEQLEQVLELTARQQALVLVQLSQHFADHRQRCGNR